MREHSNMDSDAPAMMDAGYHIYVPPRLPYGNTHNVALEDMEISYLINLSFPFSNLLLSGDEVKLLETTKYPFPFSMIMYGRDTAPFSLI